MGKDIHVASMDVEATAVIKKNSKNNNTKGCVKVTGEVTVAHPFCVRGNSFFSFA